MKKYDKPVMEILKFINNDSIANLALWLESSGVDENYITTRAVDFMSVS